MLNLSLPNGLMLCTDGDTTRDLSADNQQEILTWPLMVEFT